MATLTFAQDFTSSVSLDSSLVGVPDSGLYWNRGVNQLVSLNNILAFLPNVDFTFSAYAAGTTYSKFADSKSKTDIVTSSGLIYESIASSNIGNTPASSPTKWLETNMDSLRIKSFLWTVDENFKSALQLSRKLIENQYIYNVGKTARTSSDNFIGWAFEPKNSDYVKIKINQICLQATTTDPVSLYVINQGRLIDTLTLTPEDGILEFDDLNYTISGNGTFYFIIESIEVLSEASYNDALKYDGFVCYPVVGNGDDKLTCDYIETAYGNGLNFNVSCYLDSSVYISNNEVDLAKFKQTQFEMDAMELFLYNANNRVNIDERMVMSNEIRSLIATNSFDLQANTVAKKYAYELEQAKKAINRTFDSFLKAGNKRSFSVEQTTI